MFLSEGSRTRFWLYIYPLNLHKSMGSMHQFLPYTAHLVAVCISLYPLAHWGSMHQFLSFGPLGSMHQFLYPTAHWVAGSKPNPSQHNVEVE
jgi:hypothetical protein